MSGKKKEVAQNGLPTVNDETKKKSRSKKINADQYIGMFQHETIKAKMLGALANNLGNISLAAKETGIHRDTHYNWMKLDVNYKKEFEAITEMTIDFVEASILKNINKGNVIAQIFYLKTKAKHRGYIESQHIDHTSDGKPLTIQFQIKKRGE